MKSHFSSRDVFVQETRTLTIHLLHSNKSRPAAYVAQLIKFSFVYNTRSQGTYKVMQDVRFTENKQRNNNFSNRNHTQANLA